MSEAVTGWPAETIRFVKPPIGLNGRLASFFQGPRPAPLGKVADRLLNCLRLSMPIFSGGYVSARYVIALLSSWAGFRGDQYHPDLQPGCRTHSAE
jgi:hypothetical protein